MSYIACKKTLWIFHIYNILSNRTKYIFFSIEENSYDYFFNQSMNK